MDRDLREFLIIAAVMTLAVGSVCALCAAFYEIGRVRGFQSAPLVCGDSLNPSGIRRVPLKRPTGPVR